MKHTVLSGPRTRAAASIDISRHWLKQSEAVLLLTATPEQFGTAGHFARLRLLDPARFHSLESYLSEEKQHAETVELVNHLLDNQAMAEDDLARLRSAH